MGGDTVPEHLGFKHPQWSSVFQPNQRGWHFSFVSAGALSMMTSTRESWWSANTWTGCFRRDSLSTIIFNFLPAAAEQRLNKRRSERLSRLNSPAKRNGSQRFCLHSAEAAHVDRLCCPCIHVFSPCLFTAHASHTGILQGGINGALVGAFIYIPLRCSSLWKQNKYNIFYSNHLFTRLSSVCLVKTGPRGAAKPPSVSVMVGHQNVYRNCIHTSKGYLERFRLESFKPKVKVSFNKTE